MSRSAAPLEMSAAVYLAWERKQPVKHQLLGGAVYAMVDGSPRHNHLCVSILAQLHAALRGGPCRAFSSDQKIHVPESGDYVYPDGAVVCGSVELHPGTPDVIVNPAVVIEVLSASTERHDRDEKWSDYRSVGSLKDYVLVAQRIPRVEHFRREADGSWRYRVAGPGGRLELSTGSVVSIDELYEGAFELPSD